MSHVKVVMIGTRDNLQKIYDSVGDSSAETSAELAFGYDYLDNNVDFYAFRESRAFNSVELKWTKNDAEYQHLLDEIKDHIRCPDIIDIRTDKLGTKIKIKFNLDLTQVAPTLKNSFTLTESGNTRLITNATVDVTNPSYLILTVATDSLSEYINKYQLKLSYNAP